MGSGCDTIEETIELPQRARARRSACVKVHLYRPFCAKHFLAAIPATCKKIAVLDRTKEPGSLGEPLYLDVCSALREAGRDDIKVVGGRYGLGSKEFTPTMVKAVYDNLARRNEEPLHRGHRRRRDRHLPEAGRAVRRRSRRHRLLQVLRPRLRRHRRRQQELHQDHRRPHRYVRAGLFRLRLQEVRRPDRQPPALRQDAHHSPPT